jgi:acyl-CoA thioesterase-2
MVAAQAVIAAARVEPDRRHSLHSYFLRPGGTTYRCASSVSRIRDGRTFTTRT